jgi:hypothetical protein
MSGTFMDLAERRNGSYVERRAAVFTNSANMPIEMRFMLIMSCLPFPVRAKEKCFLHPNTERAGGIFDQLIWRDDMREQRIIRFIRPVYEAGFLSKWLGPDEA